MMQAGQWLEASEPGHVLDEVKTYARRHPGFFLVAAVALGAVAERMTKNAIGETSDDGAPPLPRPGDGTVHIGAAGTFGHGCALAPSAVRPMDAYPSQPAGS
jgi:hypothetical protein